MTSDFKNKLMDAACQIAEEFDKQEQRMEYLRQELEDEKKKNKEFLRTIISLIENRISEN